MPDIFDRISPDETDTFDEIETEDSAVDQITSRMEDLLSKYDAKDRRRQNSVLTKEITSLVKSEVAKIKPVQKVIERIETKPVHIPPRIVEAPPQIIKEVRVEVPAKDKRDLVEQKAVDALSAKIATLEKELALTRGIVGNFGGSGVIGIPNPEGNPGKVLTVVSNQATWQAPTGGGGGTPATVYPKIPFGSRLTTESGVPVSGSDRTAQGTIYYTAGIIQLFNGTAWQEYTFAELSLALTVTPGSNYDVFCVLALGVPSLILGSAWASNSARTDAVSLQDGAYVMTSDKTKRYLGTIRGTGTNAIDDSAARRFVWNAYNQARRQLLRLINTASWTYAVHGFRQANGDTNNQVEVVIGLQGPIVEISASSLARASAVAGEQAIVAVGEDDTTTASVNCLFGPTAEATATNILVTNVADYRNTVSLGYHFFPALESVTNGTWTFFGSTSERGIGLLGFVEA